jgi:ferredoxin
MRIRVDPELCSGHARCGEVAPEVYELDDEGYNELRHQGVVEVPPGLEAAVGRGMRVCPERAITIVEDAIVGTPTPGTAGS